MNIEDKLVVFQILDIWMRLTSIRWHGKPWNKYDMFTPYAEGLGLRNVGHMLNAIVLVNLKKEMLEVCTWLMLGCCGWRHTQVLGINLLAI